MKRRRLHVFKRGGTREQASIGCARRKRAIGTRERQPRRLASVKGLHILSSLIGEFGGNTATAKRSVDVNKTLVRGPGHYGRSLGAVKPRAQSF